MTTPGTPGTPGTAAVRLAITLGDPRGIGPEVTRAALSALEGVRAGRDATAAPSFLLVGPREADDGSFPFEATRAPADDPGLAAGEAIERATELALAGEVDGIVTAPLHKPSLIAAGFEYPGHTEMLQALSGSDAVGMLMCLEPTAATNTDRLRVLLATTHIPLSAVPQAVTKDLIERQTRLLGRALQADWCIPHPRIALCALNPHASDGGLFGDEEERVYAPALEALSQETWSTTGPIPADTVFHRALQGEFDAVVAPYHDVGMAAFKTAAFGAGVNVTIGLPFVRTS
ncbi:MAG: PdxA family dehydrogenase, partial [Longimicrobiales bacterium]